MVNASGGGSQSRGPGGRVPSEIFDAFKERLDPIFGDLLGSIDTQLEDNPFIAGITGGQEDLLRKLGGLSGSLDALPNQLKRTALASTDAGAVAAAQAAKAAGGGRGGAAFGGGGGVAVATRAASQAATQQSAALASSLVQGEQARAAFELQLGSLQSGVAGQLQRGRIAQAGFANQGIDARRQFLDLLGQIARSGISGAGGSPSTRSRGRQGSSSFGLGGGAGGGGGAEG